MSQDKTFYDSCLDRAKNHKAVVWSMLVTAAIIAIGSAVAGVRSIADGVTDVAVVFRGDESDQIEDRAALQSEPRVTRGDAVDEYFSDDIARVPKLLEDESAADVMNRLLEVPSQRRKEVFSDFYKGKWVVS